MSEQNTNTEKKAARITCRFFDQTGKQHFPRPQANGAALAVIYKPVGGSEKTLGLKWDALKGHPGLVAQLALFGASVHLRNAVNTEKDEEIAEARLLARIEAFKRGDYGAATESVKESTPLVVLAFKNALEEAKVPAETVEAKVAEKLDAWEKADRAGKAALRSRLMGNKKVQKAFQALMVERQKPADKEEKLEDL